MFTFVIQLIDLVAWGSVGLFLSFFIVSWAIHIFKQVKSMKYHNTYYFNKQTVARGVSIILPVVDEDREVFEEVLNGLITEAQDIPHEIIVVANGSESELNAKQAAERDLTVVRVAKASKRQAIAAGVALAKYPYTIILDSDTVVGQHAIKYTLSAFADEQVGGVTPEHVVLHNGNFMRRISNWLEDIRFNEILKGQNGAVSCLPGRMLAIRTDLLKSAVPELLTQKFLGAPCISGDDRFLTSWMLERGWKTVFTDKAIVYTEAPGSLGEFMAQRLRWSRTSLRETIRSLKWGTKYPYMTFTTVANVVLRWWFFIVILNMVLVLADVIDQDHYLMQVNPMFNNALFIIVGLFVGFVISGFLRNARHLWKYPQDLSILIPFLFITTFILTPVEWYGNLTLRESGWMTRKTEDKTSE